MHWPPCSLWSATSATYQSGSKQCSTCFALCLCCVVCVKLCIILWILDAAEEDVSFSHQSEQLAESLQGLSCRIYILYISESGCLQNVAFLSFQRQSTVQCVSGTKYETFPGPFSCFVISVKASQMISTTSPPSSIELYHPFIHSCKRETYTGFIILWLFFFICS